MVVEVDELNIMTRTGLGREMVVPKLATWKKTTMTIKIGLMQKKDYAVKLFEKPSESDS